MDQRDEQDFAEYFAAKRDSARRTAYMLCGDWHKADDLAQTAFVALHRRWKKIRDRAATDAYLRKTLVRASIEATIGWDFGPRSIVEDAQFALIFSATPVQAAAPSLVARTENFGRAMREIEGASRQGRSLHHSDFAVIEPQNP